MIGSTALWVCGLLYPTPIREYKSCLLAVYTCFVRLQLILPLYLPKITFSISSLLNICFFTLFVRAHLVPKITHKCGWNKSFQIWISIIEHHQMALIETKQPRNILPQPAPVPNKTVHHSYRKKGEFGTSARERYLVIWAATRSTLPLPYCTWYCGAKFRTWFTVVSMLSFAKFEVAGVLILA
ncbi:hypothetical protein VTL71DRAFT_11740 [Oculimacula yallundae]|uniref:Uncharacterized protein n=1 Tax=Oculimacula yallundae TaxID=86028 RepID=A0ABR4CRK6_9HELO